MLHPNEEVIHAGNYLRYLYPVVGGAKKSRGGKPRPWGTYPCGSMPSAPKASVQKIPRSEWSQIIKDRAAAGALLSQTRLTAWDGKPIPSRDQNGKGYCWSHSTTTAAILKRMAEGQPYVSLSAYAIACIIKGFRDEGGWNGESMQFLSEKGCPDEQHWPQQSMSRSNDNPATWENAAKYKDFEWQDIPNRDFDMLMTFLLMGIPCPLDLNWWSHSICAADPVDGASTFGMQRAESGKLLTFEEHKVIWEMDFGGYGVRIWNSWGDDWSALGMGVLTESKATPDGSIALCGMEAA